MDDIRGNIDLEEISIELDLISDEIDSLDDNNFMEACRIAYLFTRWDYLDQILENNLYTIKRKGLKVIQGESKNNKNKALQTKISIIK